MSDNQKFSTTQSKWLGRKKKGEQDTNSFQAFVKRAKVSKVGKEHLKTHHKGYGL